MHYRKHLGASLTKQGQAPCSYRAVSVAAPLVGAIIVSVAATLVVAPNEFRVSSAISESFNMLQKHIPPHGGKLVNRVIEGNQRDYLLERSYTLREVHLTKRDAQDLEMIAIGAYSPLEGFMTREDWTSVLKHKRLKNGLVWTIPITLAVEEEEARPIKEGEDISLLNETGECLAVLHLEDKFHRDKEKECEATFGTKDISHPGVNYLNSTSDTLLGGRLSVIRLPSHHNFLDYRLKPSQTRQVFLERNWKRIAGFQTRNPIHRAHEYLQKCALEIVDGLFIHPLVGETKGDDVPPEVRLKSYEVVLQKYYPKDRYLLAVFQAPMRYAGPNEAIFHAIVRKNFGCTHFIVGRDHAGVGNFYGSFDAHYIFDEFKPEELGITPLFFDNAFYCQSCLNMATYKTCPHDPKAHITLSGTKVRELLKNRKAPPTEITRPEVAEVLIEGLTRAEYQI